MVVCFGLNPLASSHATRFTVSVSWFEHRAVCWLDVYSTSTSF